MCVLWTSSSKRQPRWSTQAVVSDSEAGLVAHQLLCTCMFATLITTQSFGTHAGNKRPPPPTAAPGSACSSFPCSNGGVCSTANESSDTIKTVCVDAFDKRYGAGYCRVRKAACVHDGFRSNCMSTCGCSASGSAAHSGYRRRTQESIFSCRCASGFSGPRCENEAGWDTSLVAFVQHSSQSRQGQLRLRLNANSTMPVTGSALTLSYRQNATVLCSAPQAQQRCALDQRWVVTSAALAMVRISISRLQTADNYGGAISATKSHIVVRSSTFRGDVANHHAADHKAPPGQAHKRFAYSYGGAVYVSGGTSSFKHCGFEANEAVHGPPSCHACQACFCHECAFC